MAIPAWQPLAAAALIAAVTLLAFRMRRSRPYLLAGWIWFAVAILPPIGVVQVGRQAMADRFTYIPSIGLTLIAVWGCAELLRTRPAVAAALAAVSITACAAASLRHIGTWHDSVAVFENTLAVTRDNSGAQHYLAAALDDRGRYREALPHHAESVRLDPAYFIAQNSYARDLERTGDCAAAADHFAAAIRYFPNYAEARFHLGLCLEGLGRPREARPQIEEALRIGLSEADAAEARRLLARSTSSP
jgi:tetratricopeptide (TPR) repeat protein